MRWLCMALMVGGCSKATTIVDAGTVAPEPECTLATPLTPGVPGSPGHLIPSERNPNGDSELAAQMRMMQSDLESARALILDGHAPPPLYATHRKIRCAWPTVADDRNPSFDANAVGYLARVKALDAATDDRSRRAGFESVISGCLACHAVTCPGPIAAITPLRLPAAQ